MNSLIAHLTAHLLWMQPNMLTICMIVVLSDKQPVDLCDMNKVSRSAGKYATEVMAM